MGEGRTSGNRVSVYQAAEVMGVTVDAIRKRISRGTIPHERGDDGRVWVILDTDQDAASKVQDTDQPQSDVTALISAKDETIAALREQLEEANERDRENRRIIAALTSRIPAIEAPTEPPGGSETVEEEPERPEPRPAAGGAQEGTERPQQRRGWLAPVDKLPWWQYMLGLSLVFSGGFLTYTLTFGISSDAPVLVWLPKVVAAAWAPPGIFGFWVGYRKSNLRLWSQVLPLAALVGAVAWLGLSSAGHSTFLYAHLLSAFNLIPLALVFFPAWLLFVSASLVGNTWQRRRIGRISGTTPASPVSRSTQGAAQQPRKDLTPAQQAMLGWGGTIISALITLVGTIIAVRSGG